MLCGSLSTRSATAPSRLRSFSSTGRRRHVPAPYDRLGKVDARPWNMHAARTSQWWLIPQDENGNWPAFNLGKLAFLFGRELGDEPNTILVGRRVERGLSELAEGLGWSGGVLTENWMWTKRFARELATGHVTSAARRVAERSGVDVRAWFALGPGVPAGSPKIDRTW